jgi:uncharacterized protein YciI
MTILLIEYEVADFAEWKAVFDRDPMGRGAHGVTRHSIHHDIDEPTRFLLSLEFRSAGEARSFRDALAPVWDMSGARRAWILEETEAVTYPGDATSEPATRKTNHFLYKLIPPRPTFAADMTPAEAAVMAQHAAYWQQLTDAGTAVVFGPVLDPASVWGLAVVAADTEDDVSRLGAGDPAVRSGVATFAVYPMPDAAVRS